MSNHGSIIPEFMAQNQNDTFKLLFPLKLVLDEDRFGNSHFDVVIKNMTKNEVFSYKLSPELLFTHFPIEKSFANGKKNNFYKNKYIEEKSFFINTSILNETNTKRLHQILDEKDIVSLIGWKRTFLNDAKYANCYLIKQDDIQIILPHFAIAIYYYFRFTEMREAVLDCNLDSLYKFCCDDRDDAKIVLNTPRTDEDAAFIYRFACQNTARNAFDNMGKYVHHYLNYMRNLEKVVDSIPIKATFPVKGKFQIDTRVNTFTNNETKEKFYFIYEIVNDYSDIGFNKFTKIIERNKYIPNINNIDNLPKVDKEVPHNTTEVLKPVPATKKYTQTQHQKDRKKTCGSLNNIEIDSKVVTQEIIKDLLKIYQESESKDEIDQSLTDSGTKGEKTVRKVVISSSFEKIEIKPLNEIDNFVVFRQYLNFLQKQSNIENLYSSDVKYIPEFTIKKDNKEKINPKCKINKRARQYLTTTFKYTDSYIGLIELENYPSSAASSWVIISNSHITEDIFNSFIELYFKEDKTISDMIEKHKKTNPKFTKKNHERNKIFDDIQLAKWYIGLVAKIR
ncbi:hypothetical protein HOO34_00400 [Aliarcobacter cryaerophilus]|uniref:TnsE C-terminal domain-containing protein n=1 Tax=Aliarcobacter cryaerophilus TaxID=28198 RepID=A0A7G9LNN9_9BACT|nr:hypothetical protein [Aliarcobacter cryaerophilus]QNM90238.1 hypothetical protein HOO34_00400 [Aliarcobacter cryaerophilus]